jgi:hypothetical protein
MCDTGKYIIAVIIFFAYRNESGTYNPVYWIAYLLIYSYWAVSPLLKLPLTRVVIKIKIKRYRFMEL